MIDQSIEETNQYKHLGVHIDTKLSFNDHVDYFCKHEPKSMD